MATYIKIVVHRVQTRQPLFVRTKYQKTVSHTCTITRKRLQAFSRVRFLRKRSTRKGYKALNETGVIVRPKTFISNR